MGCRWCGEWWVAGGLVVGCCWRIGGRLEKVVSIIINYHCHNHYQYYSISSYFYSYSHFTLILILILTIYYHHD